MIHADPAGQFVIGSDLGTDRIYVWKFDAAAGKLSPANTPFATVPPGDGPRHFAFHPNGRWLYSLQEEASTLITFDYDASTGKLTAKGTVSTLPKGFAGTNFTSEVMVSSDGKFVYAANRLHDSIAWFSIGDGGRLTFAGEEWTRGDYPRSFTIDGQFHGALNRILTNALRTEGHRPSDQGHNHDAGGRVFQHGLLPLLIDLGDLQVALGGLHVGLNLVVAGHALVAGGLGGADLGLHLLARRLGPR